MAVPLPDSASPVQMRGGHRGPPLMPITTFALVSEIDESATRVGGQQLHPHLFADAQA